MKCPKCKEGQVLARYSNTAVDFSVDSIDEDGSVYTGEIENIDFAHSDGPEFLCDKECDAISFDEVVDALVEDAKNG